MTKRKKALLSLALLFLIIFLVVLFNINVLSSADNSINLFFSNSGNLFIINISKIIGYIFEPLNVIILSIIIAFFLFIQKYKREAVTFAVSMLAGGAFMYLVKEIVQRARPENALILESSSSFPSGHALISLIFFGFLTYLALKNIKSKTYKTILSIVLIMIILFIGASRLILNVHWFSDVLAGWLLGLSILLGVISAEKRRV